MNIINIIEIMIMCISFIISLISLFYTLKTKKRYEKVVMQLGNGEDITNILSKYIKQVSGINEKDEQIIEYCNRLNNETSTAIKKIGLIKYDSYSDTKNDLSFALALLDRNNDGIVINSIYGVDDSHIYAKPITKGTSKSRLSSEEEQAISKAISSK